MSRRRFPRVNMDYDPERTVHFIGDMHVPFEPVRLAQIGADIAQRPDPLGFVQIGDSTDNGLPEQDTDALAFLDGLPAPWWSIIGNHDIEFDVRTPAAWETAYGMQKNQVVDLGPFCLLLAGPDTAPGSAIVLSQDTLDWMDAQLAAATKPHLVCVHAPLQNTVMSLAFRATNFADYYTSPTKEIKEILNAREAAVAWISGHTHSHPTLAAGFVTHAPLGSRRIPVINCSATRYVGHQLPALASDPLCSVLVTVTEDEEVQVRVCDHKTGGFLPMRPYGMVARLRSVADSPAELIASDDFNRADGPLVEAVTGQDWTAGTANFQIVGGKVKAGGTLAQNAVTYLANLGVSDVEVRAKVKLSAGTSDVGVQVRRTSAGDFLFAQIAANAANNRVALRKRTVVPAASTDLAVASIPALVAGSTHFLAVRAIGNTIEVDLDGVTVITHTLSEPDAAMFASQARHGLWLNSNSTTNGDDGQSEIDDFEVFDA